MTVRELYRAISSFRVQVVKYDPTTYDEKIVFDDKDDSLNRIENWIKYRDEEVQLIGGYFNYNDSEIILQIDISKYPSDDENQSMPDYTMLY